MEAELELAAKKEKATQWLADVAAAETEEKKYRDYAKEAVDLYECESETTPFNILFSNTETLAPALYNSVPRPRVTRRQKKTDPVAKAAATLVERYLKYAIDDETADYTSLDKLLQKVILQALTAGRGVLRFRYDATFKETAQAEKAEGETPKEEVSSESIHGELVPWNRFTHGFALEWKAVPWVAFEHYMSEEDLERAFGEEIADAVTLNMSSRDVSGNEEGKQDCDDMFARVYEIWDKEEKMVYFASDGYDKGFLKEVEDPLGLVSFFPCPEPLQFIPAVNSLKVIPPYKAYEEQAKELNHLTTRIRNLIQALRVRGFYDATLEGMDKLASAGDSEFLPIENAMGLGNGTGSLDKALWMMPLEKLVTALTQMQAQRQQVKQVIYEITGIADIMRGASAASETLGAQQLKNQWGTMRLKRSQRAVVHYVRSCLRIMAEIAVTKLGAEALRSLTELDFPLQAEKDQAQAELAVWQQQQQVAQQSAPPVPGQPPAPPTQPPANLTEPLQKPSMEDLLKLLRDDALRSHRIDIQTDSTIADEVAENKKDTAETMTALGQFLQSIGPMVAQGVMPFDAAKAMLMGIIRNFRFGDDVEDLLAGMKPPAPPPPPPPESNPAIAKELRDAQTAKQQLTAQQHQMELAAARHEVEKIKFMADKAVASSQIAAERQLVQVQAALGAAQTKLGALQSQTQIAISLVEREDAARSSEAEQAVLDLQAQGDLFATDLQLVVDTINNHLDTSMSTAESLQQAGNGFAVVAEPLQQSFEGA